MNKAQTDFSDAIFKMNGEKIMGALAKGAIINKSNTRKNTINYAIRVLLDKPVDEFNTKFIEVLFDAGATICNVYSNKSTLEIILNGMNEYIKKAKTINKSDMAIKNIIKLLILIISQGGMLRYYMVFRNLTDRQSGTGLEIIKMLYEHNIFPNLIKYGNALSGAVTSKNPEIIYEIIMRGEKPDNTYHSYSWQYSTFDAFYDNMYDCDDIKIFNHIINLLMCSGAIIHDYVVDKFKSESNSYNKKKIECCYNLLQLKKIQTDEELQDKNELKKELIKTMKELMEGRVPKINIVEQIDIGTQICIPVPCIEMIYDYQRPVSLVQFIDWSKY